MNNGRILFVIFLIVVFFSLILIRLYSIQISDHDDYDYFAKRQQIESRSIRAERGFIYDRNGELLVYDRNDVSFFIDKRMMNNERIEKISEKFSSVFGRKKSFYKNKFRNDSIIFCLQRKAPRAKALQFKDFVVDGLFSKEDPTRIYSYANIGAHVLGHVGDNYTGIEGIEKYYNEELTGKDGRLSIERDVKGRMISIAEGTNINPVPGKSIVLTIDLTYQKILQDELSKGLETFMGVSAVGILLNPYNGEVLAMANVPDYDPNIYWKFPDENRRNRCLTDPYEPGSTFKGITISALLDLKLCRETEIINTENGTYRFRGRNIRDTHDHAFLTVREVIEQSSNIGMAKLVSRIEADEFYKYLRNYGFGNFTGIDLPGESKGKLKKPGNFNPYTMPFMSFGYEVSVTPVQLAAAYAALINGGKLYQPHFLKEISRRNSQQIIKPDLMYVRDVIDPSTSARIRDFLKGVVENGTGKSALNEKISVGGKTGTSQQLINNRYTTNYNSSFVGFFPAEKPEILCLIMVNNPRIGGYGGLVAAPIFKNITDRIITANPSLIPLHEDTRKSFEQVFTSAKVSSEKIYSNISPEQHSKTVLKRSDLNKKIMPDLVNSTLRDALSILSEIGLKYSVTGNGRVVTQSIKPGEAIKPGLTCILTCEEKKLSGIKIN